MAENTLKERTHPKSPSEILKNVPHHLARIDRYVSSHSEEFQSPRPFYCTIDYDGLVDIIIKTESGEINLNALLPKKIKFRHVHGGMDAGMATRSWDTRGRLESMDIDFDFKWAVNHPAVGATGLAHEIGHCLSFGDEDHIKKTDLPDLPTETPQTEAQVEDLIEICCQHTCYKMEDEIQAWSYGKTIATVFGIEDASYENVMDYCLKGYLAGIFFKLREVIESCAKELNLSSIDKIKVNKPLSIYDLAAQEIRIIDYSQLIQFLKKFDQDYYEKTGRDQSSLYDLP